MSTRLINRDSLQLDATRKHRMPNDYLLHRFVCPCFQLCPEMCPIYLFIVSNKITKLFQHGLKFSFICCHSNCLLKECECSHCCDVQAVSHENQADEGIRKHMFYRSTFAISLVEPTENDDILLKFFTTKKEKQQIER